MVVASRRVSYILPSPTEAPPLLQLPPLGQSRQGQTNPTLIPKSDAPNGTGVTLKSKNPFLSTPTTAITSLVLDTSTVLENHQSPGGILYSGGRDGLVASWELNVPHRKRRGRRYELPPGRAAKVRWERIGDGAELWDEEDEAEFGEDVDGNSSDEDSQGWVGVDGEDTRKRKGEVAYEDRWEVDQDLLQQQKVSPLR
jgi:WD repeat-containing protein 48